MKGIPKHSAIKSFLSGLIEHLDIIENVMYLNRIGILNQTYVCIWCIPQ